MFRIPQEQLPDCLKDEERINVLFAPLRSRGVNPKDWESKLLSWKSILKVYCEVNDIYTISLSQLNDVFIRNGRPPNCLNELIQFMLNTGEIQSIEIFRRKNANSWSGWAVGLLTWPISKVKDKMFSVKNMDQIFVYLDVVQSKSNNLFESVPAKLKMKLINLRDLLGVLNKDSSQVDNIKLLLNYLQNQHKLDVTQLNEQKDEMETFLIKFGDGSVVVPISEIDIGTYSLEQNEKKLLKNIESLEDEIQVCIHEAKVHLTKKHKQLAKSALRKKHDLEKRVGKKMNTLHNIQRLLEQIQDTHNDAHVWEAYKKALGAFNTSFKDSGLSEKAIDETMVLLGDVLDEHNDIQQALARPPLDDFNDEDLENELAELLNDFKNIPPPDDSGISASDLEKDMANMSLNLPEVPDSSPDVSKNEVISV